MAKNSVKWYKWCRMCHCCKPVQFWAARGKLPVGPEEAEGRRWTRTSWRIIVRSKPSNLLNQSVWVLYFVPHCKALMTKRRLATWVPVDWWVIVDTETIPWCPIGIIIGQGRTKNLKTPHDIQRKAAVSVDHILSSLSPTIQMLLADGARCLAYLYLWYVSLYQYLQIQMVCDVDL